MHRLRMTVIGLGVMLLAAQTLGAGAISGDVRDESGNPLMGAHVWLDGTSLGTTTRENGSFTISSAPEGHYTITTTFVGYRAGSSEVQLGSDDVRVDFILTVGAIAGEEVVISAARRPQKLVDAVGNVEVVTSDRLQRIGGYSSATAMEQVKGVHTYRTGIDGVGINARGFMTGYNYRFQLMTDGMSSMLTGNGLSAAHMTPAPREDIERIELVVGPSSALYGPNAHNGLLNIITRHPRDSQGTTLVLGAGQNGMKSLRGRYASAQGPVSWKLNLEHLQGNDWNDNRTYWFDKPETDGPPNGIMDAGETTVEGNDSPIQHTRINAAGYYELRPNLELGVGYGWYTFSTRNITNIGHNILRDWVIQNGFVQLNHPRFFARIHGIGNTSGDYYQEDVRAKLQIMTGADPEDVIHDINLVDRSRKLGAEVQGNIRLHGFNLIGGISADRELPISKRTVLLDHGTDPLSGEVTGEDIVIDQYGIYGQVEMELPFSLSATSAFRYDTHDNYDSQFSPRFGLNYRGLRGNLRVTWNRAYQAPSVAQQYLYIYVPAGPQSRYQCGNGLGFTLADGSTIDPLQPEINQTTEIGYRGVPLPDLFLDASYYYSRYENFISGFIPVGPATAMGDTPLDSNYPLFTYLNFGELDLQGIDLGVSYRVHPQLTVRGSLSYIDNSGFEEAKAAKASTDEAPYWSDFHFNTPEWKWTLGFSTSNLLLQGLILDLNLRHVAAYDFVTGLWSATADGEGGTLPPAAGNPYYLDPGQLGGFTLLDLGATYRLNKTISFMLNVENLLDTQAYQMVGSPATRRFGTFEVKLNY